MTNDRPLDVLYVLRSYPERSQTFVIDEISMMRERGWNVAVVHLEEPKDRYTDHPVEGRLIPFPQPGAPTATTSVRRLRKLGRLARLWARRFMRRPANTLRATLLAAASARRYGIAHVLHALAIADVVPRDVRRVHAHFAWESASIALLVAELLGAPFSVTVHGNDLYDQRFDLERKLRRAQPVITTCDYFRRELAAIEPSVSVAVVPLPVDPQRFERSSAWRHDPFTIVSVGRLVEKKGYADLVSAMELVHREVPGARCIIGGDGPLREELEAQVVALGLDDVVAFRGSLSHESVRELMETGTVFAAPFVVARNGDRDAMPVVLKEAMSLRMPIVSTMEVGVPELVDDTMGRLVPPHEPAALADAIIELARMPAEKLRAMGDAGRDRVLSGYTPAVTLPRIERLFGLVAD
ncbi:MAG: glycosyltransferase [Nitriliruptorales bacterium]|nr:glycosyltransferase [Nitriliruptorales bacterium]